MSRQNKHESKSEDWEKARQAAARAALKAWREAIQPFYGKPCAVREKEDGPCTEADRAADELIVEALQRDYPKPQTAYLTEESEATAERLKSEHVWIIDPIDGTKDFIKQNGNFAVHIAMVERFDNAWLPVAAVVFRPVAGLLYSAVRGAGSWRLKIGEEIARSEPGRGESIHVSVRADLSQMRSAVSNSHRESRLMRFIHSLELQDYWHIGSLGIKVAQVAEGNAELYVNLALGRAKEWDACAPQLILTEAGGRMTDLSGGEITYNREDYHLRRGILASNGASHDLLVRKAQEFLEADCKSHA